MQVRPMKQSSARSPHFYAGLSFVAAVVTIALKVGAYLPTGSVSLFSDEILSTTLKSVERERREHPLHVAPGASIHARLHGVYGAGMRVIDDDQCSGGEAGLGLVLGIGVRGDLPAL
jgi:hypothetical protein